MFTIQLDTNQKYCLILQAAKVDGAVVAELYPKLKLRELTVDDEFTIAGAAFTENPDSSSKYFQHFAHLNAEHRFELLLKCVTADPDKALKLVDKFELKEPAQRLQAACIWAQVDGWFFSVQVGNWDFKEVSERLTLAKMALQNHLTGTLRCLKNYNLDEPSLFALMHDAIQAKNSPENSHVKLIEYIEPQAYTSQQKYQLATHYATQSPGACLAEISQWNFSPEETTYLMQLASTSLKGN